MIRMLTDKMIRRHPHVFGNVEAQNAEEAVKSWEEAKNLKTGMRANHC